MKLHSIAVAVLAALLCSCAATSVKKTWKTANFESPAGKIAVLTIDDRSMLRQGFENRFVKQLTMAGSSAFATFDLLSLPQIKQDKRAAADRLVAQGAGSLLLMRLIDQTTTYHEGYPAAETVAPGLSVSDTLGWYDYYSMGYSEMSPSYVSVKQRFYLETTLYDLKTEKPLWSALTQTVLTDNMDRVAEMDPLVGKIVAAMRKDGVLR